MHSEGSYDSRSAVLDSFFWVEIQTFIKVYKIAKKDSCCFEVCLELLFWKSLWEPSAFIVMRQIVTNYEMQLLIPHFMRYLPFPKFFVHIIIPYPFAFGMLPWKFRDAVVSLRQYVICPKKGSSQWQHPLIICSQQNLMSFGHCIFCWTTSLCQHCLYIICIQTLMRELTVWCFFCHIGLVCISCHNEDEIQM